MSNHDDLRRLADQVERLRPPGHRDPERFWIAKSDLAHQLRALADKWEHSFHNGRVRRPLAREAAR